MTDLRLEERGAERRDELTPRVSWWVADAVIDERDPETPLGEARAAIQ